MLIQIMNLLLVVSVAWTLCNPLQLERNPAGSSGLTVCSHCFREMEQRLQPCVKNLETFDLCYWKWNHEVLPHFPSHVRDVSPAVRPQWNSLQHKKHKKSKESGMWTSYFTRLSRKTPLLPVFFFPFLFWPKNTCENGLLQTLNMSCGKLRKRTKYQHLAGQLLLSVSDKTRRRFSRTLKNTGGKKTIINRL